jgi:hypothetical protein
MTVNRKLAGIVVGSMAMFGLQAHAASVDAVFDGYSVSPKLHYAQVEVLAVDSKLMMGGEVYLKPGNHLLTLVSKRDPRTGTRARQQTTFTAEPCMRYIVAADHGEAMRDDWTLVLVSKNLRAGCAPSAYTPPPPPEPKRFLGFDQELSMLGDRLAVAMIGARCGELTDDPARGAKAIERWEKQNGRAVDAVARRVQAMVITRGSIGGYERSVQTLQIFEEGIAERREALVAETLGAGDLVPACTAALATLEKRVDVYDRSQAARKAVKDANTYNSKYGEQFGPMIDKNWANLVEDAEVIGGYWTASRNTPAQ